MLSGSGEGSTGKLAGYLTFTGRGHCSVGGRAGRCRRGSWNRHGNRFSGNGPGLGRRQSRARGSAALPRRPRPVCFRG